MPELPEIEIVRRDLEREIVGRRIKEVEVRPGSNAMKIMKRHGRRKEFQDLLAGAKVESIDRLGRKILLHLDADRVMVIDLGTTGLLTKTSTSGEMASHTHIIIGFTIGGQLRLVDPKLTSEVFVTSQAELDEAGTPFAIDPLDNNPITWPQFSAALQERKALLKELLLDDGFICGLGDIYSDEVLFAAGLKFDRTSDKLSSQDVRRLYRGLVETLQDAVKQRGTTWGSENFHDLQGNPGQYQLELKVFERDGEPCRRCRHEIVKEEVNGRFTYYCPQCQS